MPRHVYDIHDHLEEAREGAKTADYNSGKARIGTGPFKFVEYVPGDRIVLERNENLLGQQARVDQGHLQAHQVGAVPGRGAAGRGRGPHRAVPTTDIER